MIERAAATLGVRREAGKVFAAGRSAPPTIAAHQLQPKRRRDLSIHHLPGRRAEMQCASLTIAVDSDSFQRQRLHCGCPLTLWRGNPQWGTRGAGILVHLCAVRPRLRLTPHQSPSQSRLAAGAFPTGGAVPRRRASSACARAGRRASTACMPLRSRAHVYRSSSKRCLLA
eukprot:scaffold16223_cov66-Phaeocystis_antarctica.AAC.7